MKVKPAVSGAWGSCLNRAPAYYALLARPKQPVQATGGYLLMALAHEKLPSHIIKAKSWPLGWAHSTKSTARNCDM